MLFSPGFVEFFPLAGIWCNMSSRPASFVVIFKVPFKGPQIWKHVKFHILLGIIVFGVVPMILCILEELEPVTLVPEK